VWDRVVRETEAHGLWRRGRKEEALRAFESVLMGDAIGWRALWNVGQLALELGRLDQAERAFRALWQWDGPLAYLYLGRLLERTGRPAEAREAYEFFAYAWRNADPGLQPVVDETRQAVARLSGAEE
jgi:tetratricopeptide (TPR) repeat protein